MHGGTPSRIVPPPMRNRSSVIPAVFLALGLAGIPGCACPTDRTGGRPEDPDPAIAPAGGASGRFVGSEVCAGCHAEIHAAWTGSRHRATLRPVLPDDPAIAAFAGGPFRISGDGSAEGPGRDGATLGVRAAYRLGGSDREDLWVRLPDGRLQVWPLSRDAESHEVFSPVKRIAGGAEPPPDSVHFWLGLGRNADLRCHACHATGARTVTAGTTPAGNPVPASRWVEPGVGCEACHGPGGPHVDAANRGAERPAYATGAAERACEGCHALRDLLESPFAPAPSHPYGSAPWEVADPLSSSAADVEFREPFFPDMRPATYQQEAIALSQSGCAQKGGLSCADCHDPHGGGSRMTEGGGVSAVCARCHGDLAADVESHSGHRPGEPGSRCEDCHMAPILRGPARAAATDHSLAPPVARPGEIPAACARCHDRTEGREAVAERAARPPRSVAGKRRLEIRAAVEASVDGRPDAAKRLAAIAAEPEEAWFVRWAALRRLADVPPERDVDAVRRAARSLLDDPHPALRRASISVLGRWGSAEDAAAIAPRIESAPAHEAVAAANAIVELGVPDAGGRLTALLRRPEVADDYRAHASFGTLALRARDWTRAERALSRSLELHPIQVPALNELGIALWELGRFDEARGAWRRALEWNPAYEAARRNLEEPGP